MKKFHRNYSLNNVNMNANGTVIFIVLVFILSVTALVLISSSALRSEVDFVENELARLKAYTACVSGMEYLKNRLLTTTRGDVEFTDLLNNPLSPRLLLDGSDIEVQVQNMVFYLNLQDSAGLINVFKIERPMFKDLCEYCGVPGENAEVILDSLYDWMDPDDFVRPRGVESDYYHENYGYTAANRLIESRDELLLVRGFRGLDKTAFNKLGGLLDFSIENQGMNPNTMPPEAFHIFKGLSDEKIQLIIRKRRENNFEGPAELTLASGYNFTVYPQVLQFFTSNTTYVKIKASMQTNESRFYYIMLRLDQVAGAGAMRGEQQRAAAPGAIARNREEDFGFYFHTFSLQEGTERGSKNLNDE